MSTLDDFFSNSELQQSNTERAHERVLTLDEPFGEQVGDNNGVVSLQPDEDWPAEVPVGTSMYVYEEEEKIFMDTWEADWQSEHHVGFLTDM